MNMKKILVFAILLGLVVPAILAPARTVIWRKYGVAATIPIDIYDSNSPWRLYESAPAAGSPAINAGVDLGNTYRWALGSTSVWSSAIVSIDQRMNGPAPEKGAFVYGLRTNIYGLARKVAAP